MNELAHALSDPALVQSFSGVRTVFDGREKISAAHKALALAYGYVYAKNACKKGNANFLVGRDPRPSGVALANALTRGFLAGAADVGCKLDIVNLGIITTPLAETAIRSLDSEGGVIITASHNPLSHNGFKFLTGCRMHEFSDAPPGALLSAEAMKNVILEVEKLATEQDPVIGKRIESISEEQVASVLGDTHNDASRLKAERAYIDVVARDWSISPHCLKPFVLGPVLVDPNGGAGCAIDARVLEHFGVRTVEINAELGYPEHTIDTDGIDPVNGRHTLVRVARAAAREHCNFGVAFDYDADRGNLVLPGRDESAIIPPQQAASFNIAVALARRTQEKNDGKKLAVVISDATSLASEKIAESFGAEVHFVETGEINVVTRMHTLRNQGYDVPVGVEGANGGTIFETSTCRDGLQTALSAALAESEPGLVENWCRVVAKINGCNALDDRPHTLRELLQTIPVNHNVFLRMSAPPLAHSEIKKQMESNFVDHHWPALSRHFSSYKFINFEGTRISETRTGDESGGWRLVVENSERKAFVFLRGSRTEAGVWRMIVDAENEDDFQLLHDAALDSFNRITD